MRHIKKKHSTKPERIVIELLKELHIPFKHRWIIQNHEVDFLIGKYVLEINGHEQNGPRNHFLADLGYIPIHLNNEEIYKNKLQIKTLLNNIWHLQTSRTESPVLASR